MPNLYYTLTGERVSQGVIDKRRAQAYKEYAENQDVHECRGCGGQAQGFAHTIAQARCKVLHKTEYIWSLFNFWPACHKCNSDFESYKGDACKKLLNYEHLLEVLKNHDYGGWLKYTHL